jgi:lipoic acid synthetase
MVHQKKPSWLKSRIPTGSHYRHLKSMFRELDLHTVCEEARCPNVADCWNRQTATLMIMGDICTRSCGFCAVTTGRPLALDPKEPEHVAEAIERLGLKHVVITSVDRDDLPDGGSAHFARTITALKARCPQTQIEVLIPDFKGHRKDLQRVFEAGPDILNHNIETVPSLQGYVRPQARYDRSLQVLHWAAEAGLVAKSGIMLGLGETDEEIAETISDLKNDGRISILTLGQYLQPTPNHLPVRRYVPPGEFADWKTFAESIGIPNVASGPMVRSSYHADEISISKQAVKIIHQVGHDRQGQGAAPDAQPT